MLLNKNVKIRKTMLNVEFEEYFKKCPAVLPRYVGCYSINNFPQKLKTRTFFITNLSPSGEIGSHWISIIKSSPNLIEIFDSLATKYEVLKPYLKFKPETNIVFNDCAFQSPTSTSCGFFCITFCVNRCLNFDLKYKEVLEHVFTDDLNKNETIVKEFVLEL